jgi:hypothetical protein
MTKTSPRSTYLRLLYHNNIQQAWYNLPRLVTAAKKYEKECSAPILHVNTGTLTTTQKAPHADWIVSVFNRMRLHVALPDLASWGANMDVRQNTPGEKKPLSHVFQKAAFSVLAPAEPTKPLKTPDVTIINGVGIFGLGPSRFAANSSSQTSSSESSQLLQQAVQQAKTVIQRLQQQGISKVVVLSQLGFEQNQQLAKTVSGIDVIVGGQSPHVLKGVMDGINWLKSPDGQPVLVAQAGKQAEYLGVADLTFDDHGHLTYVGNRVIPTHRFTPHVPTLQYLESKLGKNTQAGWLTCPLFSDDYQQAKLFREWLATQLKLSTKADIALIQSSAWQGDLPAGPVTQWQLKTAFPRAKQPYITFKLPIKQFLPYIDQLNPAHVMISPFVLKRSAQGVPVAIWSEYKRSWLTDNDLVAITLNKSHADTLFSQLASPLASQSVTHTVNVSDLLAGLLSRMREFQYTA